MKYLVESYLSRQNAGAVDEAAVRAREASEQLLPEGKHVRYLRTIFVPEDETCFHLYDASTADLIAEAFARAQIPCDRIVEARTAT